MSIKSELDRQRLTYTAFKYDAGTGMYQGYNGTSWSYLDKLRYNSGTSLFEGWNGSTWGSIGGGLTITPIDPTFSSPLAVGKHYLLDMTTATGDVTLSLPAGGTGSNIKIMVFANTATSYRLILQANGSDTIYYNGTTSGTFRVSPANFWVELGWIPSPSSYWVAESAGDISSEITARQNADSTITSNLNLEITARQNADSTLTSNLNLEITARQNSDSTITSNLNLEVTARQNSDSTITSNLNLEITARQNADSTITSNLNLEITARANADSTIMAKAMTALDPSPESTFTYYTRSDFTFDRATFFGSTTGTNNILTAGKIVLNATQQFISANLVGSVMIADAPIVNAAQANILYNPGFIDSSPTVSISRDGGNSWVAAWQQTVSGKAVVADVLFPSSSSPLFDAGTPNGTQTAAFYIAEIFQPTFHTTFTAFGAYVKLASASSSGTVVGKLMAVAGGVPTTTIATSRETLVVGQDITTTSAYKVFSFANVVLHPDTQYALVLYSTGMAVNLSADQATSAPAYILGSATSANGSSWTGSGSTDLAFQIYGTGIDVQLKVVSGTASSELVGFGVEMVLDTPTTYAGDASFETRVITATEATTGTITLYSVRFTPGTHQLHCNVSGHDFVAPSFSELGGGVVQFPINFFSTGDVANFYVTYGLTNLSNVPVTINNMVSSNSTLGSVTIPSGFTLDKPWMDIPAGATVSGSGNIETTGTITGAGILASSGTVLSTGKMATQPKFDSVQEYTATKGVAVQGRTDGIGARAGCIGEVISQVRPFTATIGLTSAVGANVTASPIVIPVGVWLVSGNVFVNVSTTMTIITAGLSLTSATLPPTAAFSTPDASGQILVYQLPGSASGQAQSAVLPTFTLTLASPVTLYLVTQSTFAGSGSASGFVQAVRIA